MLCPPVDDEQTGHAAKRGAATALVIPTLNAGANWRSCIAAIRSQSLLPRRLLVIDSSSTDETVELARDAGFETVKIERRQFNHGGTRQWAIEQISDCEIVVFLTQDAILASVESLAEIMRCFNDPGVAVAYGRQLPHEGSTPIEAHARLFNYPPHTITKDLESARWLGAKVFFCSNSFAAYRLSVLRSIGGFRHDLILGEDMEYAARAVKAGYSNVYCATAAVYHSHDYTLRQMIERYFDIGAFDAENRWMRREFGSHRGEGLRFLRSELLFLAKNGPSSIPRALLLTVAKLLGYRLGRSHKSLPVGWRIKLSMLPDFWR